MFYDQTNTGIARCNIRGNKVYKGSTTTIPLMTVAGSKAGSVYVVELTENGFNCSCTGFQFYGKCKHSSQVIEGFEYGF